MGRKNAGIKTVCENRKARHDYFIHETYEAGIALQGTEVKSLRAGRANLKDSYASIQDGELFVENLHISPYDQGNIFNHDPLRRRKLLMHKAEIVKKAFFGPVTPEVPASILQMHPDFTLVGDEEALSLI